MLSRNCALAPEPDRRGRQPAGEERGPRDAAALTPAAVTACRRISPIVSRIVWTYSSIENGFMTHRAPTLSTKSRLPSPALSPVTNTNPALRVGRVRLHPTEEILTRDPTRHPHVGDDQVEGVALQMLDRLAPGGDATTSAPSASRMSRCRSTSVGSSSTIEHRSRRGGPAPGLAPRRGGRGRSRTASSSCPHASGSSILNRAPPSGAFSAVIRPPCCWTTA